MIPDDHVLVRVDTVLELDRLPSEVHGLYCADNGRPGIDPEVAIRLMLAGFLLGIVHDRRLMREAQVNLAIGWFVGCEVQEALPDHFSLTRIRQRWGEEVFRRIFTRVVRQCQAAGLVTAGTVHVDASLIRADISMDALIERHLDAVDEANEAERLSRATGRHKKLCRTDPEASMATASKAPLRPSYKQHTAVDDHSGIVVRHRWRVEGTHGTAKTLHGSSRAIRRGLENMKIQALLTAIAMNLKKLARAAFNPVVLLVQNNGHLPRPAST